MGSHVGPDPFDYLEFAAVIQFLDRASGLIFRRSSQQIARVMGVLDPRFVFAVCFNTL